jgi:hypothetical protein
MGVFDLLPDRFRQRSISSRELVLPVPDALEAIDLLEAKGVSILGWEGWVKDPQGRVGHWSAPQGTVSLEKLSPHEAAELCRKTIRLDAKRWVSENPTTDETLHICITARA